MENKPGLTPLGAIVSVLLIAGLVGLGFHVLKRNEAPPPVTTAETADAAKDGKKFEALTEVPKLEPSAPYVPKDNVVEIELSEYAGYAGLIAANGGLAPSEQSYFFQKHGFKVKIKLSEEESWSALNAGRMAASATTVDVLAVYGRQFNVVTPVQIGFSRGADGIVVRSSVKRINALKGQAITTAQFTESDFFIRYLAQEAGMPVGVLSDPEAKPDPEKINLVYTEDAFAAGDQFLADLKGGKNRLAGCVTWEPKTSEVVAESNRQASALVTNRNLLIVADIFIVNKPFAQANPKMVEGLVDGLLYGNRMVRDQQAAQLPAVAKAFKWTPEKAQAELAKVHLSNLPENIAFFNGSIDAAGSYEGIYQSAVYAYGKELLPQPAGAEKFLSLTWLEALQKAGAYSDQKVAISPIRSGGAAAVEENPLLSKDIRFYFEPNSSVLDQKEQKNFDRLADIHKLLQVSPGSTVLLRGHVDDGLVAQFRQQGGEAFVRTMALRAMELSKTRAAEVKKVLVDREKIEPARVEIVGRGWEEPAGKTSEEKRRVEVQWFTVE